MRYGELCAGIGGLSIALERLGFEPAWFVENNEFCQKILKKHWPSTPLYGDLKKLNSSVPGSPASPSVSQGNSMERATPGTSGLKYSEPSLIYDPLTRSLRTCQVSLLTNTLEPFSGTYMKQGTMRSGAVFPRKKSVPPIGGNGSSSWPTPDVNTSTYSGEGYGPNLRERALRWPTPDTMNPGDGQPYEKLKSALDARRERTKKAVAEGRVKPGSGLGENLIMAVAKQNWMTPNTMAQQGGEGGRIRYCLEGKGGWALASQVSLYGRQAPQTQKGGPTSSSDGPTSHQPQVKRLNPMFVEWLMGLPVGWTELPD